MSLYSMNVIMEYLYIVLAIKYVLLYKNFVRRIAFISKLLTTIPLCTQQ